MSWLAAKTSSSVSSRLKPNAPPKQRPPKRNGPRRLPSRSRTRLKTSPSSPPIASPDTEPEPTRVVVAETRAPETVTQDQPAEELASSNDPLPTSWSGDQSWRTGDSSPQDGSRARTKDWLPPATTAAEPVDISEHLEPGLELGITMTETLSSATHQVGDVFEAELSEDLYGDDGQLLLPAGTTIEGRVTEARKLRRVGGRAASRHRDRASRPRRPGL